MHKLKLPAIIITLIFALSFSCTNPLSELSDDFGTISYLIDIEDFEGWTYESHSSEASPNYELIFGDNETTVHRLDITISPENYEIMETDMEDNYGSFGSSRGVGSTDNDPVYIPVSLKFNDQSWWYVGMRYKGNSSLRESWQAGVHKLPFRLDFDHFDYIYNFSDDQCFWGFNKMTFSSGYNDETLIRDMMALNIFREGGVEAPEASFCEVYIDTGDGAKYWGLYTMIEDPSDQMLKEQFGNDSGNLYKPDDEDYSTLSDNHYDTDYYEKKTNESSSDWSDIEALIEELNNNIPEDDTVAWESLDELFDIDHFLNYLAINNTIQNWDVYGSKAHNYYLYADPSENDQFTWFPWDLNESFSDDSKCSDIDVGSEYKQGNYNGWPLLNNILGMTYYEDLYKSKVATYFDKLGGSYSLTDIQNQIVTYSSLIEDYALAEEEGYTWYSSRFDSSDYNDAVDELTNHISDRFDAVESYIE